MDRSRLVLIAAFGASVLMTGLAIWQITRNSDSIPDVASYAPSDKPPGEPVEVTVDPNMSSQEIGNRLEDAGVIASATQFRVLVALLGYDRDLQAGDYEFDRGSAVLQVIYRMRSGAISTRSVTVIEGWRLGQIADAVAEQGIPKDEFLAAASAKDYGFDFLADLQRNQTLEGYLFPATYPIRRADTGRDVVAKMLNAFYQQVGADVRNAAKNAGLKLNDAVTLASIIEREARVPSERPIMAQVFLTRLRRGIPLEADPTVQYAVAQDPESVQQYGYWKQELTEADLQANSPYNTYRSRGLPPGPICSPGLDSILAVVKPADTNYLYFVAKPDGSHAFAATLAEHQRNVDKYRGQ